MEHLGKDTSSSSKNSRELRVDAETVRSMYRREEIKQPPLTPRQQRHIRRRLKRGMRDPLTRHLALEVVRLRNDVRQRDEQVREQEAAVAKRDELMRQIQRQAGRGQMLYLRLINENKSLRKELRLPHSWQYEWEQKLAEDRVGGGSYPDQLRMLRLELDEARESLTYYYDAVEFLETALLSIPLEITTPGGATVKFYSNS